MNYFYRNIRRIVGAIVRSLHPRAIAWKLRYGAGPSRPIITALGEENPLKVRIYSKDVIGAQIYRYRVFERSEVRLVLSFLRPGMVFVDAGANLGQYTLLAAQRVGASGQVHSFEPSMRMFNELSYNVTLNSLNGICTLNNAALSNLEGTGRLSRYLPGAEVYGSLGRSADPYGRITGYDEVKVTTLDLYAQENAIKHIDMLKIDIEGAELPALRGAHSILGGEDGPAIIIEMADCNTAAFDYKAIEIWDYLVSLGYAWFAFDKRARLSPASRPGDFEAARNLVALKGTDRLRALQSARF